MQTYELETLPCVTFAHVYHAQSYFNTFSDRKNALEISYISAGSITVELDGTEYEAHKGDVVCLPYDRTQLRIRANAYHEHHTVYAQVKWARLNHANGLYLPLITPARFNTAAPQAIIRQFVHDPLLFKNSPTKGAAKFLELLCEIDRCNRKQQMPHLPSEALYTQYAKEYVQKNIHFPITQKSAAAHLSISPEYLCSVFKKTTGLRFMQYVNTEKLEAIQALMAKEHIHLYEAAALFGYSDPNYVSRLFKKYYGYSITAKTTEF